MKKSARISLIGLVIFGILTVSGCTAAKAPLIEPTVLEGADREAVVDALRPTADSLLSGLTANDYELFSKDFNEDVRKGMDRSAFEALTSLLAEKLGQFQSSEITTVLQESQYSTLVYSLTYDDGGTVMMRVVFLRTEPPQIAGIWFDSPVLVQ